ncbi:hypothetical protein IAT38_001824 [Cryptococcus sp. DSM 104549]
MRASRQIATLLRSSRVASPVLPARNARYASTNMGMPAMSPTMTEGGISSWKKQEGESFAAGDVLLEVETDKATIDVEAQEDGVMGKILVKDGAKNIPVGQIIAILAEEGDDLSAIEIPSDTSPPSAPNSSPSSSSDPAAKTDVEEPKRGGEEPKRVEARKEETGEVKVEKHGHKEVKHDKPLFPSVSRLLQESDLTPSQISSLKGTGRHGMLTKGDVLLALGKIKSAYGSAEKLNVDVMGPSGKRASENAATEAKPAPKKEAPLDGPALRRLIIQGMARATAPAEPIVPHDRPTLPLSSDAAFDDILSPYASLLPAPQPEVSIPGEAALKATESQGSVGEKKKDEWAGLW